MSLTMIDKDLCYVSGVFYYEDGSYLLPCDSNTSEENRVLWCTTLAAVSRGKERSANPSVRYKALLKEAAPMIEGQNGSPSRPLEFIPVVLRVNFNSPTGVRVFIRSKTNTFSSDFVDLPITDFMNTIMKFSFLEKIRGGEYLLKTNMRALLNSGLRYEDIPYNTKEELKDFKAVKVRAPMFVFNHLVTHTMLSKEARSERVVDFIDSQEFYPEPFDRPFWKPENVTDELLDSYIHRMSFSAVMKDLKELGFPKEIYQRAILEWRYKTFIMCGWDNELTWRHLFEERGAGDHVNWTQEETKRTVKCIKAVIDSLEDKINM